MIDPDNIQILENNLPDIIKIVRVPEFDFEPYNLEDDKDYEHFVKDVEKSVRRSFEYKQLVKYLRENMGMDKCAYLKDVSNNETFDIKIEIHHYPFSLRDIVEIVFRKRSFYNEYLSVEMCAKEAMELHYKLLIGLISLSQTVHELAHSGRIFIPVDRVLGRYNLFVEYYKPFCLPEQLETLERIEKYSREKSDILNTTILEQNKLNYDIKDNKFALPKMNNITDDMFNRIESIKNNNYLLPSPEEEKKNKNESKKEIICPVYFTK